MPCCSDDMFWGIPAQGQSSGLSTVCLAEFVGLPKTPPAWFLCLDDSVELAVGLCFWLVYTIVNMRTYTCAYRHTFSCRPLCIMCVYTSAWSHLHCLLPQQQCACMHAYRQTPSNTRQQRGGIWAHACLHPCLHAGSPEFCLRSICIYAPSSTFAVSPSCTCFIWLQAWLCK